MTVYRVFTLVIVMCVRAVFTHLFRHREIKEKYMWMWFALNVTALGRVTHLVWVHTVARMTGFGVTSNIVLLAVTLFLAVLSIHLIMVITRLEGDRRTFTEQVVILRHDLGRLESRMEE